MVKTTVVIRDELYEALVESSFQLTKSKRKVSQVLNDILAKHFGKRDMFGSTKATPAQIRAMHRNLREKHDRLD